MKEFLYFYFIYALLLSGDTTFMLSALLHFHNQLFWSAALDLLRIFWL